MKYTLLLAAMMILISNQVFSQKDKEAYEAISSFQGSLFNSGQCQRATIAIFCEGTTFTVIETIGDIVHVKIEPGSPVCDNNAIVGNIYCINKELFNCRACISTLSKKWTADLGGGVLTIPFKFDQSSFKVFPAGELGGVGGLRITHVKSNTTLIIGAILGLSSIPLNDLNSPNGTDIKTVSGITTGAGLSINVAKGFQFGVYYGIDFYNNDNTKYQKNWLSFGFGYDFFKFKDDTRSTQPSATLMSAPL